jgi:hypothetical protein
MKRNKQRSKQIEISPLKCKRLQQVEFRFLGAKRDEVDPLLKYLLNGIKLVKIQIIMMPKQ